MESRTSGVRPSQRARASSQSSRSLPKARRIVGSGDESAGSGNTMTAHTLSFWRMSQAPCRAWSGSKSPRYLCPAEQKDLLLGTSYMRPSYMSGNLQYHSQRTQTYFRLSLNQANSTYNQHLSGAHYCISICSMCSNSSILQEILAPSAFQWRLRRKPWAIPQSSWFLARFGFSYL